MRQVIATTTIGTSMRLIALLLFASASGFAIEAAAQSTLTFFGKIDSAYVDAIGTRTTKGNKGLGEGAQSRVGVRGAEDLGGGLQAFFWLESRFRSDTGALTASRFLQGQSIVGLRGPWGSVSMGRDYVAGYVDVQLAPDPFIHTGVSSMVLVATGGVGTVRNDNAVTYKLTAGKLSFEAQRADAEDPNSTAVPVTTSERPFGFSFAYRDGGISAGYNYENPGRANDYWHFLMGKARFGELAFSVAAGRGKATTLEKRRSFMLGGELSVGVARFKLAYGNLQNAASQASIMRKLAVGYNYNLSQRTFVYANVARDSAAIADKTGLDVGVQHNF